ncbi:MvdC/MvdD family ATP grasp protein [Spirillospora sp. CA-253888]
MTDADDHTADLIVSELTQRGETVMRLDPGAAGVDMDVELTGGRWRNVIQDEHRAVRLEDVVSVLWRWPTPPAGHPAIVDDACRAWAAREDTAALHGVLRSLPVRWINHPGAVAMANFKPVQLRAANEVGFTVPPTLITTSGEMARRWAARREVLYKAFHSQGVDDCRMVMATPVNGAELPPQLGAASMFQEIVGGRQVRVTCVGRVAFAVVITGADRVDWRGIPNVGYRPLDVPRDVHRALLLYLSRFGLEYGAFDFVIDDSGDWVFLECNPLGMYGFVEIATGLPITKAIADRLCTPLSSPVTDPRPMRS